MSMKGRRGARYDVAPAAGVIPAAASPGSSRRRSSRSQRRLKVRSGLGEPAGVLSWEREFLLPIVADFLNDFVRATDDEDP